MDEQEVLKLVFLCVPGDAHGRRPKKGMVPLERGADWEAFCARACRRLGLTAIGGIYAWDGGPRISSIQGLLEVDEGRTLVVLEAAEPVHAPGVHSAGCGDSLKSHLSVSAPPRGASGTPGHAGTATATCRNTAASAAVLKTVRVSGAGDAPPSLAPHGANGAAAADTDDAANEDKYASRKRRLPPTQRVEPSTVFTGVSNSSRSTALSLPRVAGLALLICALVMFSVWMGAYQQVHVLEQIRERSERRAGGGAQARGWQRPALGVAHVHSTGQG